MYIAFEGVMGTGKTTLTKFVAEHLKAKTMYEIVEENPFLEKFYKDPKHWSLQTEVFFLCNRYMQLKKIQEELNKKNLIIGDYHIMKNLIFAEITLEGEELKKYRQLYNVMIDGFNYPDIVVYSEASANEILRRIRIRGRNMEKDIDKVYIENLIELYKDKMSLENLRKHYPGTQLIKINADKIDFYKDPGRIEDLYRLIDIAIGDNSVIFQVLE